MCVVYLHFKFNGASYIFFWHSYLEDYVSYYDDIENYFQVSAQPWFHCCPCNCIQYISRPCARAL